MESSKNSTNFRNFMYSGKHALLPPKIPFPSASPVYADYVPSSVIGSKVIQKPKGGNRSTHHQRTSSENFLIEEQPSWLDDLLNEPETPVQRGGHRRSSSDSLAYVDTADISNLDYLAQGHYRLNNMMPVHSWGSQQFDYLKDAPKTASYAKANLIKQRHRAWGSPFTAAAHLSAHKSAGETATTQSSESSCAKAEADGSPPVREKQDNVEASTLDSKPPPERKDGSNPKLPSEIDTKRAKQQFAQRSRVRKLQYIAELEKKVQALQAEGSEISSELQFVNQQSLILSMENKALKQRLENLAQEQLIKYLEQGVLEKEIGRLRALYQQQQQKQQNQLQPSAGLRRSSSLDLDSQFDNLSLKHKDAKSSHDSITGALHM